MRVGIIGGGATGLAAGYYLSPEHEVVIFEAAPVPGGLVRSEPVGEGRVEEFYHLLLPSDQDLVRLIGELGLSSDLLWHTPSSSIYIGGKLYPFTSPRDILSFPELSLSRRLALGLMVYRARWRKDWRSLDRISAREWVIRQAGRGVYDKVWAPLLHSKFDRDADRVSAAWLWNKFKLRGTSKNKTMSSELVGYLEGSFTRIYDRLGEKIRAAGGEIRCGSRVEALKILPGGGLEIAVPGDPERFDAIIAAVAPAELARICPDLPEDYRLRLEKVKYKANLCFRLELSRGLSPYYWILAADDSLPFVAVIEHTNFASLPGSDSRLVYLSRYLDPDDNLFSASDREIEELFISALKRMFPDLADGEIKSSALFRARYAQPVTSVGYLDLLPPPVTPVPGLYLASMAQIYPQDRGQSYAVKIAQEVSGLVGRRPG